MIYKTDWRIVIIAYLAGVAGAIQVGRVAPAVEAIVSELSVTLSVFGWAISLITLASALGGVLAGILVSRWGERRFILIGCGILAFATSLSTIAPSVHWLLLLRACEGVGYLIIVIAAPTLIALSSSRTDLAKALALWATFFNVGIGIAALSGGWLSEIFGWRMWYGLNAILCGLVLLALWAFLPKDATAALQRQRDEHPSTLPIGVWLIGFGFFGVTLSALAILSMMPSYLINVLNMSPTRAGSLAGIIAAMSIVGSVAYGHLADLRQRRLLVVIGGTIGVLATVPAFSVDIPSILSVTCLGISVIATGVLGAHVFASIPFIAQKEKNIAPANGLVAQIGSLGALAGPPAVGALVTELGWIAIPLVVAVATAVFLVLATLAEHAKKRRLRYSVLSD